MLNLDDKEKCLFEHYKRLIESLAFDEYDILGFLILIRRHLEGNHPYIREFADLIAHRRRNRGIVMDAISAAIDSAYETEDGSKRIKGYHGIQESAWRKDVEGVFSELEIACTEQTILDFSLCVYSITQYTQYECRGKNGAHYKGIIELFQNDTDELSLCTTEGERDSIYVCFAKIGKYRFNKMFPKLFPSGHIQTAVETFREEGILHLRTMQGEVII